MSIFVTLHRSYTTSSSRRYLISQACGKWRKTATKCVRECALRSLLGRNKFYGTRARCAWFSTHTPFAYYGTLNLIEPESVVELSRKPRPASNGHVYQVVAARQSSRTSPSPLTAQPSHRATEYPAALSTTGDRVSDVTCSRLPACLNPPVYKPAPPGIHRCCP